MSVGTPLEAHMTELQAVNQMLRSIGESPVQTLTDGQFDAEQAQNILRESSRRIQAPGWHANTRKAVSLTKNASDQFTVGVNVLSVDTVNPDSARRTGSPNPSAFYNVQLRRSSDNTKWVLYDLDNDRETWADGPSTMVVDIVEFLRFENLPPNLQIYIYKAAAHQFQKSSLASRVVYEFTKEDVEQSMVDAIQEDAANEDRNMFRHNRAAYEVVRRNNPMYNT